MKASHARLIVTAAVMTLAATACSVSSGDDASSDTSAPATTGTPSDTATPDTAAPAATDTPGTTVPVRGVTEDTLKLGVAVIDVNTLREQFGVDIGQIPDGTIDALVASVNGAGGINGRQIEVVQRPFMPVGNEASETACRELIEDEQVFAVLGMFLGDNALCVTETYSTPYFAPFGLSAERQERSLAPFVSVEGEVGAVAESSVQQFLDEGLFEGAKVAVYHEGAESPQMIEEHVLAPLEAAGVDVVSTAQLPSSGDAVQAATDIDRIFQRFEADGADTLLVVAGAAVVLPGLERTAWAPQLLFTNGQFTSGDALDGFGLTDPAELDGAYASTLSIPSEALVDDPELIECLDAINANTGTDYTTDDIFSAEERRGSREIGLVVGVCQLWDMATTVLTAAGEDLSPDGLLAGLDAVGEFSVAGRPNAMLSAERWGADDEVRLWTWDVAAQKFVPVAG